MKPMKPMKNALLNLRFRSRAATAREAGFTLIETLVTLVVLTEVIVGILLLFDAAEKLSRAQTHIAEMQSSQRIAQHELSRMVRMAGVGGLPQGAPPAGLGLAVDNGVTGGDPISGDANAPTLVDGTDVLTVRGVFSTPVYFLVPQVALGNGTLQVQVNEQVDIGLVQDLEPLREDLERAKTGNRPEAVIVRDVTNPRAFAVLELDPGTTEPGSAGDPSLSIGLRFNGATYETEYGTLTQGSTLSQGAGGTTVNGVQLPANVGSIGILEEYRFYVREEWEVRGEPTTRPTPVLSRARLYPGTTDLHPEGSIDLADNVIDLQIALGIDRPAPAPDPGLITEVGDGADDDEVLYNFPGDAAFAGQLLFLRLNTLVQADRPDRDFPGLRLGVIEDHDYTAPGAPFNDELVDEKLRKRLLTTVIELRNLP